MHLRSALTLALLCPTMVLAAGQGEVVKPFAPKGGGFTVHLPGTPGEQRQTVQTASGAVAVTLYLLDLAGGEKTLVVGYSELPASGIKPGTEEKRLESARDGAVASAKGKLKREGRITLGKHPGREFVIAVSDKVEVRTRMYAVRNRLYQALAVGPPAWVHSAEVGKFLDSFKLIE